MTLLGVPASGDSSFTADLRALPQQALPGWSHEAITRIMQERGLGEIDPLKDCVDSDVLDEIVQGKDGEELHDLEPTWRTQYMA